MKFTYLGKAYDLFEDNIIDKENFLASEDNDTGQNIILKHGIRQICDFFGFKDYDLKILLAQDTNTWGTTFVLEQRMIRRAEKENEPIEDRMFTGDGEINEKNCSFPYPIAVGRKRARSRAVLWELGLEAYGEEEAEDFAKEVRKQREKKPTFTGSIVPAVKLLGQLIDSEQFPVSLPELFQTVRLIPGLQIYNELAQDNSIS